MLQHGSMDIHREKLVTSDLVDYLRWIRRLTIGITALAFAGLVLPSLPLLASSIAVLVSLFAFVLSVARPRSFSKFRSRRESPQALQSRYVSSPSTSLAWDSKSGAFMQLWRSIMIQRELSLQAALRLHRSVSSGAEG
jgi:hypothetical protein